MFEGLIFLFRECWLNVRRQGLMALASVSTAAISLTIVAILAGIGWQVYAVLHGMPRRMEVHAFLRADVPAEQASALVEEIRGIPGVTRVELIPKEQAWAEYRQSSPHKDLLDGFEENPLPDKLHIAAATPEETLRIAEQVRGMALIHEVSEGRQVLRQLVTLFNVAKTIGIVVGLLLVLGAAAIVSNAIRVTLYARRRDIRVMQLVGATNGFIRFPFVLEGVFAGALGGLLACGILAAAMHYYSTQILPHVPLVNQFYLALDMPQTCLALVTMGAAIGMMGSLFSLRRFLQPA